MKTIKPLIVILAATQMLSACMIFGGPADRALRRTPSFKSGYADGCAAANEADTNYRRGVHKDDALYKTDKVYRQGWATGYQSCRNGSTPVNPSTANTDPIAPMGPGSR